MTSSREKCVVCGRPTSSFNYGAYSCSACSSFFRRYIVAPKHFEDCIDEEKCLKDLKSSVHFDCKYCRFHKCVTVGMLSTWRFTHFSKLIETLTTMDSKRENAFLNGAIPDEFKTELMMARSSVMLDEKPANLILDCHDWGFLTQLTTIEHLKMMGFTKFLSSQDLNLFLRSNHVPYNILTTARRSYNAKQEFMFYPNGVDIFPESVKGASYISPSLLNRIRGILVSRFIDLKIAEEEFILLCAIIASNPGFSDISYTGRQILSSYQNIYSSSLFQYCTTKYQRNSHIRFLELLSVLNVVTKTYEDIKKYVTLFQYSQPAEQPKQLYLEGIQLFNFKTDLLKDTSHELHIDILKVHKAVLRSYCSKHQFYTFLMDSSFHTCKVCGQLTSLFNYGAYTCSACSSYFRRTLLIKTPLLPCQNYEKCFKDHNRATHSDCKFCRFQQCVQVGMLNTQKYTNLNKLMNELIVLDKKRKNITYNMTIANNFDVNSIFSYDPIKFIKKPKDLKFVSHDWGCMLQLASMEFMKSFQFTKFLSMQDLKVFLKSAHFHHTIFASAMRSFGIKQDYMSFPDGSDVFPECIANVSCYNRVLE